MAAARLHDSALDPYFDQLKAGEWITLEQAHVIVRHILRNFVIDPSDAIHHEFFYEMRPILAVGTKVEASRIRLFRRSHGCDGELKLADGNELRIECTRATDDDTGRQDALRWEHLQRYGHAPAHQTIEKRYSKHKRQIPEQYSDFMARDESLAAISRLLTGSFQRKNAKFDGNISDSLILTFDDWVIPIPKEKREFLPPVLNFWNASRNGSLFENVFVVGGSCSIVWDSREPDTISYVDDLTGSGNDS